MPHTYVSPTEVISPKRQWTLVTILYDRGEENGALALGRWEGEPVVAMRWNGSDSNPIGNPQSRGLPTWFIVPQEFRTAILNELKQLAPDKERQAREFFVDSVVFSNTIAMPDTRKSIQAAVLDGIGERLERESWRVKIFEPQNSPEYVIKIEGPKGFAWNRTFFGPVEQTPAFICEKVREATRG
jgi:hypothetical protein